MFIFESMFMLQLSHASLPIFSFIYVVSDNLQSVKYFISVLRYVIHAALFNFFLLLHIHQEV